MTSYETAPGVEPARIETFRRMRKRYKHGEQIVEQPPLYDDFFIDVTPTLIRD